MRLLVRKTLAREDVAPASGEGSSDDEEMLDAMPMQQLRRARALSQEQLAEALRVKQGSVSKLERRTDLYISTLRRYIEAMCGELELRANFPDGPIAITSLGEIDDSPKTDHDDEPMQATG